MQKLFFKNTRGDKLCGILSDPVQNKKGAVVILCHGFGSNKDSQTSKKLEEILNVNGISTFRFDFFGHGESEGNIEEITISNCVDDVLDVIKFLRNSGYKNVGLMGSSFGGMVSIMVGSKVNNLFVLALKSPVSNFEELEEFRRSEKEIEEWRERGYFYIGKKFKLNFSFFEDVKNNNGYEAAKNIKIPTLIVHGDKDDIVPIEQSKKTADLIENCKLEVISGADHFYSKLEDFEKMINLISRFIIERYRLL